MPHVVLNFEPDPTGDLSRAQSAMMLVHAERSGRAMVLLSRAERRRWSLPRWRVGARAVAALGVSVAERRVSRMVDIIAAWGALESRAASGLLSFEMAGVDDPWDLPAPPMVTGDQILAAMPEALAPKTTRAA